MSNNQKLHPREVAENLKVSVRTVRRMCERGELPAVKAGGQWRIYPDWEEFIQRTMDAA